MARRPKGEGSISQRHEARYGCPPLVAGARAKHACRGPWVGMLDVSQPGQPRRRKAIYGKTLKAVQRELGKARRELEAHGDLPTAHLTVETWLTTWLRDIAADRVRPSTLVSHEQKVRLYLIPHLGRHRLDKLTPDHIRAMHRALAERGLSQNTRHQAHAVLKRALKVAVREGKVTRNVASNEFMDGPPREETEINPLNPTESAAVIEAMAGDRMESRWLAALIVGLRQGEALALAWDQVDLAEGTLTVTRALARVDGHLRMVAPKSK
ncbi:MAG: hypothetical protein QOH84_6024, partial [Kribbellaceae bacterium]|nr:hypothetical protein [Kribbellaceae bacterium]